MTSVFHEISAVEIHQALLKGEEIALLDTREEGVFGEAHCLRAVNLPLSVFELKILNLVPNKQARLIFVDDDAARVEQAGRIAREAGYNTIAVLDRITTAWRQAGLELFSGLNVPSKAFGEFVEHHYGTPHIEAADLQARLESGEEILILDSRPMDEYHAMNIPTSIDVPGGELVHRIKDLVADETTPVVVNCAGRTRSIIGCQSLINAGLQNPVLALKNGTMGWYLAGLTLEKGSTRAAPALGEEARDWGRSAAARVSDRFQVNTVSWDAVETWLQDQTRTTFVLDVRAPEEFATGHLAGSQSAPGGQLVQATDRYVGVQNARLVLVDDTETRARMAASWLVQMGWRDVVVLEGGIAAAPPSLVHSDAPDLNWICPSETVARLTVEEAISLNPVILDCQLSTRRRKKHLAGSLWVLRGRIDYEALKRVAAGRPILITGADERLAHLIAADLKAAFSEIDEDARPPLYLLEPGEDLSDWACEATAFETGMGDVLSPVEDLYYRPYDRDHGVEQAMHAYLNWEIALIEQFKRDGTLRFPSFDAMEKP